MWAFYAALGQLVAGVVLGSLLDGCTPIRTVERFELVGYWQTEGYACKGVAAPLPVRIEHDGATLRAYRRRDDACGMYGELSWSGELPSSQVRMSALPIEFSVVLNLQPAQERVQVPGLARVSSPNELVIRSSDGTRYALVRELEPTWPEDLPLPTRPGDSSGEPATKTNATTGKAGDGAAASGSAQNAGGGTANSNLGGSGASRRDAQGGSGMNRKPVDTGGMAGMSAADGGMLDSAAADSGATGGAPATMPDAGMTTPPARDAGVSEVPMDSAADAGAPVSNGPRPTDRWYCLDSRDREGLSYCNCTVDSRRHTDTCTLPKPTCCFTFNDILEQCLCYQEGSKACDSYSADGGVLPGTRVPHCPP